MNPRYLMTRGSRGKRCYCVDTQTGKRTSLHTADEKVARSLVHAKNEGDRQPQLNLHLARAYLAGTHQGMMTPPAQFLPRYELAPVAAHPQAAVAAGPLQGQARDHA